MYTLTWKRVKELTSIDFIEHPLNSFLIPKDAFEEEFGELLDEFDGSTASDYFDFYFTQCPVNRSSYRFRDDDSKEDFINACIDLGIIPSYTEVLQGETKKEQDLRKAKSSNDLVKDFKNLKSKEFSKKFHSQENKPKEKMYKSKAQQIQETFNHLVDQIQECERLNDETSLLRKQKLEDKLQRVIKLMEHSM